MSGLCKIFGKDIFKIISKESKFFSRPVDPHMQRPPRGGIWVGVTCDISKSNCKLFNCHYSDSIILNNTVQLYSTPTNRQIILGNESRASNKRKSSHYHSSYRPI
ncbi:hypothetical protein V1478_002336 [Vespula squamosa]|uniref:Uncharacterized protein n=1 Tax=Vespula squamosa TaxID=30214 RepID=A0ABD2BVU3_VESSQ